jgi:hypothetical protein
VRAQVRDLVLRGELPAVAAADRLIAAYDQDHPGDEDADADPDAQVN